MPRNENMHHLPLLRVNVELREIGAPSISLITYDSY